MEFTQETIHTASIKLHVNYQLLAKLASMLTPKMMDDLKFGDISSIGDLRSFFYENYLLINEFYVPRPELLRSFFMDNFGAPTEDLVKLIVRMSIPFIVETLISYI